MSAVLESMLFFLILDFSIDHNKTLPTTTAAVMEAGQIAGKYPHLLHINSLKVNRIK